MEDRRLVTTAAWKRPKKGSATQRQMEYFLWLQGWLAANRADMAVIEYLSVERNAQSTRVVSHYQAISALACKLQGLIVIEARVSTARKEALGRGNLSKKEAYEAIKRLIPEHNWGRIDDGGADRADAAVLALAGPAVAERV